MINLFLIFLMSLSSFSAATTTEGPQEYGVYKTYGDYKNGNLKTHKSYVSTFHVLQKFRVKFSDENGEEVIYNLKKDKIWGYVGRDYQLFRVNDYGVPYILRERGAINVYTSYSSTLDEEGNITFDQNQFIPQYSFGDNGEMTSLTKKSLKKALKSQSREYEKFKKLKGYQEIYDFIRGYNERHKK